MILVADTYEKILMGLSWAFACIFNQNLFNLTHLKCRGLLHRREPFWMWGNGLSAVIAAPDTIKNLFPVSFWIIIALLNKVTNFVCLQFFLELFFFPLVFFNVVLWGHFGRIHWDHWILPIQNNIFGWRIWALDVLLVEVFQLLIQNALLSVF